MTRKAKPGLESGLTEPSATALVVAAAAVRAPLIATQLAAWYRRVKRDLPWRRTRDPYAIWVSEVMLQQTRVVTAIPYYERFLEQFPSAAVLADASEARVLGAWSGLGYYRRARMLHAGARYVVTHHGGRVPATADALLAVPGIGPYTAGAIASIAFDESVALVDGNVQRVLARVFAIAEDLSTPRGMKLAWALARALLPRERAGEYNQALMELGATVCVPKNEPNCMECPLRKQCDAYAQGLTAVLPVPKARAKVKVEQLVALVVTSPRGLLVERQSSAGRYAGMWEVPQAAGSDPAPLLVRFAISGAVASGQLVHVLTHRRLEIVVYCVHLALKRDADRVCASSRDTLMFVDANEVEARGTSTLTRRVVELAAQHASAKRS
jgi:A/G-specific adenine glycosylase